MNPKYKAILKRASVKRVKPVVPPEWALTVAYDLIHTLEGYGDTALTRDADRIAIALHKQWKEGWRLGYNSGAEAIVQVASALVHNPSIMNGAHK
jgi:hypothetical protein